jgi:serine/threonine protein kinase, bacterial
MPLDDGAIFAGFRIVRLLGSGGMGEVYLAQHPRLPRRDALKILPAEVSADPEYRARFNREADIAAALSHPHIVGVHDRGEFEGQLWISMEYIDGTDAARLMRNRYPAGMPAGEAVEIITAVAGALDYAHQQGLLHRDVKPANILLTRPDDDGERRVFLADFGIARELADPSGLTATNITVGTVAYAAPEQLMGEEIDGHADQYALAATAYHLLTGLQLFPHSNPAVVISRHLNAEPPKLSDTRPELAPLDEVLSRALAKNPEDRFPRCQQFAQALGRGDGAISDSAPTGAQRSTRTRQQPNPESPQRRRIRATALVPAVLSLAVIGALIFVGVQLAHHRQPAPPPPAATPTPSTTAAPPPPPPAPTTPTTTTAAPPPPPPPPPPAPTTATTTTTSPTHALPMAVVGSGCRMESTLTVDPDGATVSCARIQYTDLYVWSRIPDTVPVPMSATGIEVREARPENICAKQTGWSVSRCSTAIANATYRGDGRDTTE